MRHSVYGRKLSRTTDERKRLFTGLVRDLFIRGRIHTTVAKAKAVQPIVDKLITRAKIADAYSMRKFLETIPDRSVMKQVFDEAKTRYAGRTSGYTRIIKTGMRRGDASMMAYLEFVDQRVVVEQVEPKSPPRRSTDEVEKTAAKKTIGKKTVKKTAKKV